MYNIKIRRTFPQKVYTGITLVANTCVRLCELNYYNTIS